LLFGYAVIQMTSIGFIFVPAALFMALAAVRALFR
jgi:hypothetical protein